MDASSPLLRHVGANGELLPKVPSPKQKLTITKEFEKYPPELDPVQTGNRLKDFRKRHGLTQAEICRRTGIGKTTWNNWEIGVQLPDLKQVVVLRRTYPEISLDWLYLGH